MQTVYWSKHNMFNNTSNQTLEYSPFSVLEMHNKNKPLTQDVNWIGCPAANNFLKNTFCFKNPIELNMKFNQDKTVFWPQNNLEDYISVRDFSKDEVVLDYLLPVTLFSENDISVTLTTPYLSKTNKEMCHLIPGEFNISKWFRPIVPSYMIYDNDMTFKIDKGEELFYIKFNTDKKIKFVEFYFNDTLREIVTDSIGLKRYKKNTGLSSLYNIFQSQKIDKIVLKEIEKSVI